MHLTKELSRGELAITLGDDMLESRPALARLILSGEASYTTDGVEHALRSSQASARFREAPPSVVKTASAHASPAPRPPGKVSARLVEELRESEEVDRHEAFVGDLVRDAKAQPASAATAADYAADAGDALVRDALSHARAA